MAQNRDKILAIWLFTICFFVAVMVVFGGYVRLTRSGLSMVEWHVVTGVIPPISQNTWQETFDKYQLTPEYQKINVDMTLHEYKLIYYREYFHRVLGRLAGLIYVVPLFIFLATGIIPLKKSGVYLVIGLLFALQGFMGWYMVSSGLVDAPHVSHYRLTLHLLLALALLALCFWVGLNHLRGTSTAQQSSGASILLKVLVGFGAIVVLQIAYGGLVAGLKAGHISDTFPLIFGYLIPPGLLTGVHPWIKDLVANALTVHFIHRWFAFAVLIFAIGLYFVARHHAYSRTIQRIILVIIAVTTLQILLGVGVVWWHVPVSLALIHQAVALVLFTTIFFLGHRLLFRT